MYLNKGLTMTELKCPVCKTGTVKDYRDGTYSCSNQFCPSYDEIDSSTYDTLIATKKKLDIAIEELTKIKTSAISALAKIKNAEQINQKEEKCS